MFAVEGDLLRGAVLLIELTARSQELLRRT